MDSSLTHAFNAYLASHDALEDPLVAYANAAEALFAGLLLVLFLLPHGRGRPAAFAAGLSCGLALLVAQVLSRLVDRPRPFVADPERVHLFARHAADPGFPSDHATAAFAIAVAILLRSRRLGLMVLAAATILAATRVGMGVHYPTDVIGGAALGAACALLLAARPIRSSIAEGTPTARVL